MNRFLTTALAAALLSGGCMTNFEPLDVVSEVDLERYSGRWYEIASYPAPFQSGCVGTTADYSLNDDGTVAVVNTCYDGSFDGKLRTARGTARTVADSNNAKLKVRFFIFDGDYWVLKLGDAPDYGYAVVGTPSRKFLWILSREPEMDEALYTQILDELPELGFDVALLQQTPQAP